MASIAMLVYWRVSTFETRDIDININQQLWGGNLETQWTTFYLCWYQLAQWGRWINPLRLGSAQMKTRCCGDVRENKGHTHMWDIFSLEEIPGTQSSIPELTQILHQGSKYISHQCKRTNNYFNPDILMCLENLKSTFNTMIISSRRHLDHLNSPILMPRVLKKATTGDFQRQVQAKASALPPGLWEDGP